jgi:hypothetical protein
MRVLLFLIILSAVSCSTSPSLYAPSKDKQGYTDETVVDGLRLATFQGNSATKKSSAELYAKFRAIEICFDLKKPYTHILDVRDKTYSKEITQASSTGPSYYYGMSPYYGHGAGMGMSYGTTSTTISNETYTYPMFDVYFECVDKPLDARVALIVLSQSQMQTLVKDLKGAVQVDNVLEDSPDQGKIQKGDIIIKANGERVTTVLDVFKAARKAKQQNFRIEFFRDGIKKQTEISFLDVSNLVDEVQKDILKQACKVDEISKRPICN